MTVTLYRRGTVWWAKWRTGRRVVQCSLRTRDRAVALDEKRKLERSLEAGRDVPDGSMRLDVVWARYSEHARQVKAPTTWPGDERVVLRFLEWADVVRLREITTELIGRYRTRILRRGCSPATANKFVNVLSGMLRWAVDQGWIESNPCQRIRRLKVPETPVEWLSREQLDAVLAAARKIDTATYLQIAIGALAGLRISEVRALEWRDIDFRRGLLHVRNKGRYTTKSKRNRAVPVCQKLAAILKPHQATGWLFGEPTSRCPRYGMLHKVELAAEVGHLRWHLFRHTFASLLVQNGVSLYKVGRWLGHSTPAVTQRYAHLAPEHDAEIERLSR